MSFGIDGGVNAKITHKINCADYSCLLNFSITLCLGSLDLSPPFNPVWLSGVYETEKSNDYKGIT